jgi:hypothetical protein
MVQGFGFSMKIRGFTPWACGMAVVVPVLKDWLTSPENHHLRLNGDRYWKILNRGFQLSWEPSTGPCYACEQTKGECSYNQSGGFVGWVCSEGSVRDSDCGKPRLRFIYTYFS